MSREKMITPEVLPAGLKRLTQDRPDSPADAFVGRSIKDVEKELVIKTLEQTGHNITHAAELLGISRRGLQYKLKELGIK